MLNENQMLSTRGRKDVDAKDVKVKVIVEAFDMLYLDGQVRGDTLFLRTAVPFFVAMS